MANILAAWTANVVLTSAVQCPCATATLPELKVPEQLVCVCVCAVQLDTGELWCAFLGARKGRLSEEGDFF